MPAIGLNHYNVRAAPAVMEQLRDFYRDVLGLAVGERPPFQSQGYWLYAGAVPIVHLSGVVPSDPRITRSDSTLDHIAFSCTNPEQMRACLIARGIEYKETQVPERGQLQIFCRDPAGNGIELNFTL